MNTFDKIIESNRRSYRIIVEAKGDAVFLDVAPQFYGDAEPVGMTCELARKLAAALTLAATEIGDKSA